MSLEIFRNKSGKQVADHVWFNLTMEFMQLEKELKEGAIIEFHARVKDYLKGYKGHREDVERPLERDYKLSRPTKIKVIGQETEFKLKAIYDKIKSDTINEKELREQITRVLNPPKQQKLFEFAVEDATSEDA